MALVRRTPQRGVIAFVVLFVVVFVSGIVLWQTDNLDNPLSSLRAVAELFTGEGEGMERRERGESSADMAGMRGERSGRGESSALWDIDWSRLGDVFFNLWFMLLTTIFVIVMQRPVGWIIRRLKTPPSAVPSQST